MSETFKVEHHVNRSFQEGQYCGSVTEIVITLPQKQCKRLDRAMGLCSIHWPCRKRRAALKVKQAAKNAAQQPDANSKCVQVSEEKLDESAFIATTDEMSNDDLASSSSELTPEQAVRFTQYYRQFYANLKCRLHREAQAEVARMRRHARLMAKLNDK